MVRTKVFVGNLSFQTKEPELAAEFGTAGKVISANIITRGPRSLGYGFVELDSEEDAQNAVKVMNKKEINGRPINVELARPQDETKERPPRQPREPKQVSEENGTGRMRQPRRRGPRRERREEGTQENERHVPSENNDGEMEGPRRTRNRRGRRPTGPRRVPSEDNRVESKTTLFVANLPFALDDDAFAKVVSDLGLKLKAAHVVKKRNGRSKGYGFVEFENEEDQKKALDVLNKKEVDKRELSVKIALTEVAKPVTEQQQQSKEEVKPVEKKKLPQFLLKRKLFQLKRRLLLLKRKLPLLKRKLFQLKRKLPLLKRRLFQLRRRQFLLRRRLLLLINLKKPKKWKRKLLLLKKLLKSLQKRRLFLPRKKLLQLRKKLPQLKKKLLLLRRKLSI